MASFLEELVATHTDLMAEQLSLSRQDTACLAATSRSLLAFAVNDHVWRPLLLGHTFSCGPLGTCSMTGAVLLERWGRLDAPNGLSINELVHELKVRPARMGPASLAELAALQCVESMHAIPPHQRELVSSPLGTSLREASSGDLPCIDRSNLSGNMRCLFLVGLWAEMVRATLAGSSFMPASPARFRWPSEQFGFGGPVHNGFISVDRGQLVFTGAGEWNVGPSIALHKGYPVHASDGSHSGHAKIQAREIVSTSPPYTVGAWFSVDTNDGRSSVEIGVDSGVRTCLLVRHWACMYPPVSPARRCGEGTLARQDRFVLILGG
jgi:hypothetical protein